jgi:hypothetical protein
MRMRRVLRTALGSAAILMDHDSNAASSPGLRTVHAWGSESAIAVMNFFPFISPGLGAQRILWIQPRLMNKERRFNLRDMP